MQGLASNFAVVITCVLVTWAISKGFARTGR